MALSPSSSRSAGGGSGGAHLHFGDGFPLWPNTDMGQVFTTHQMNDSAQPTANLRAPLYLFAGTYSLVVVTGDWASAGIARFALDDGSGFVDIDDPPYGASAATLDTFSAGAYDPFVEHEVATGLVIPQADLYTVRVAIDGKNVLSAGFQVQVALVLFSQTA